MTSIINKLFTGIAAKVQVSTILEKSKINDEDYFQKAFLKPIEVKLKMPSDKSKVLPQGLELALKSDISQNKYTTEEIKTIDIENIKNMQYEDIIANNLDNGISLMKSSTSQLQIAICVCMYSEDKKMLKNTIAGISQNIQYFAKSGISADKIAIFVMMDGIQKVDCSVVQYFDEMERQCNINLANDQELKSDKDIIKMQQNKDKYEQQTDNNNHILFTPGQHKQRVQKRFKKRVEEWNKVKDLKKTAQDYKNNKKALTYDVLDSRIQDFFIEVAKEEWKQQNGVSNEVDEKIPQKQYFINTYTGKENQKEGAFIKMAIQKTINYCDQYIRSRDQLALVNYFRTNVFTIKTSIKKDNKDQNGNKYNQFQDQQTQRQRTSKLNIFMCTKYKNAGKLSSHNWFFNGFCHQLNPKYAVLLDVGLKTQKKAIYKFYKYLDQNKNVGGVCGYMGLKIQRAEDELGYADGFSYDDLDIVSRFFFKIVDIQRTQQLQYHLAHLLDKPFQALFGFIHVLPGAFSAYNMKALNGKDSNNILKDYFKSIMQKVDQNNLKPSKFSPFSVVMKTLLPDFVYYWIWPLSNDSHQRLLYNENIYLAQDRILCMGIYKNNYSLAYLPDAYAWVDPMKYIHTLLGQRKRWINGSFFAFDKVKNQLNQGDGNFSCKLSLQMKFLSFMNILGYISPSLFLFTVSIAMQVFVTDVLDAHLSSFFPSAVSDAFVYVINFIYIITTMGFIFYSMNLTNRDPKFIPFIYGVSTMLGIFSLLVFLILAVDIIRGSQSFLIQNAAFIDSVDLSIELIQSMRWMIVGILGLYVVPVLIYLILYRKFVIITDMLFSAFSFLFYSPTYLNLLNIYALCRINDISWGTKGLDSSSAKNKQLQDSWSTIRLIQVGKFIFWNIITTLFLITLGSDYLTRFWITFAIMMVLVITLLVKVVLGIIYLIIYKCKSPKMPSNDSEINIQSRIDDIFKQIKPKIQKSTLQKYEQTVQTILGQFQKINQNSINMKDKITSSKIRKNIFQNTLAVSYKELNQTNKSRISKINKPGYIPLGNKTKFKKEKKNLGIIQQEQYHQVKNKKHVKLDPIEKSYPKNNYMKKQKLFEKREEKHESPDIQFESPSKRTEKSDNQELSIGGASDSKKLVEGVQRQAVSKDIWKNKKGSKKPN